MPDNRLAGAASPYLLQHADNPVAWRPWGREALAEARDAGKPVLLSVGYAACHWCHVMAHESFEDPQIAAVMNDRFVNIKVDREERPDVDQIYQTALALMGQPGGWPLTMFLDPDGEPFWGGTYFPAEAKYGRPAFPEVLTRVADLYAQGADVVGQNRQSLMEHMDRLFHQPLSGDMAPDLLDQAAQKMANHVDAAHGGIGGAPKFPQPFVFELLWRVHLRTGDQALGEAVTRTLDHLCQGGLFDHLGGGFARYSTDARWHVPHFEKMLCDNAQLIDLLSLVYPETRSPLYAERVAQTVEWLARDMTVEGGGLASSLDADSEGVEGKFYVWTAEQIREVLPAQDFAFFAEVYGVEPGGNWDGVNVLNRLDAMTPLDEESEARLAACRDALFRERQTRPRPGWDDKVLADWNGLAIAGLVRAARAFARHDWLAMAVDAFRFVCDHMAAADGRLFHAWRAGVCQETALLDDQAAMAKAALALYEATGEAGYLARAQRWADLAGAHYWHAQHGGYCLSADDAEPLILRPRSAHDGAQPSGNGLILAVLARLYHLTGKADYDDRARALATAFGAEIAHNFFPLAGYLNGYDTLVNAVQTVIVGDRRDHRLAPLFDAVDAVSLPTGVLQNVDAADALPNGHPAAGKPAMPGTALVCAGQTCSLPIDDAAALASELRKRRRRPSANV